ncbi:hypothetical protein AGMB00912_01236 [Lactiplantibacillus argentoratensis]
MLVKINSGFIQRKTLCSVKSKLIAGLVTNASALYTKRVYT